MRMMLFCLTLLTSSAMAQDLDQLSVDPQVRVTTTLGSFVIELDQRRAPLTTENFLTYVRERHYDGTIFHRVVQGFVAQGGGYTPDMQLLPTEHTVVNESGNGLSNLRGTVGMARVAEPHTANAQFYVNLTDNVDLDPRPTRWGYAVFGRIVEGMDVVDEIGHQPTGASGPFARDVPVTPVVIQHMEILHE